MAWEHSYNEYILNIECNQYVIAIVFANRIDIHDRLSMDLKFSIPTRKQVSKTGAYALGSRWIASPADSIPYVHPRRQESIPESFRARDESIAIHSGNDPSESYSMSDMLQGVASGLYYLGEFRRPSENATKTDKTNAGGVKIHDMLNQIVVCQFISHRGVDLSFLKFDPSGLLLVTAPVDGQTLHVHRLFPEMPSLDGSNQRLLYKIVRGVTHATILDAAFSADSRWLALSTARGTTHIFAMTMEGGPVDLTMYKKERKLDESETKDNLTIAPSARSLQALLDERKRYTVVLLKAVCRIRQFSPKRLDAADDDEFIPPIAGAFLNGRLYLSAWGSLSQYGFDPKVRMGKENMHKLRLDIIDQRRWDMCRQKDWQPVLTANLRETSENGTTRRKRSNLIHTELTTHRPDLVPLWAHPKVTFRVLQKPVTVLDDCTAYSQPLDIRRVGPVPLDGHTLSQALKDCNINGYFGGQGDSPVFNGQDEAPSPLKAAMIPPLQLSDSISHAVSQPTIFGSWKSDSSLLESECAARLTGQSQPVDVQDLYFSPEPRVQGRKIAEKSKQLPMELAPVEPEYIEYPIPDLD